MKLNPEELVVVTFETSDEAAALPGTIGPNHPTPMTRCFDCPVAIVEPGVAQPGTVVVAG
jgi:hypothetical protein